MLEDDLKQPSRKEWASFWSLVCLQIFQSFNVNVAKFVLVALAAWLLSIHQAFRGIEHVIVIALVIPYVLFARGLRHVPAAEAGLIGLVEPVLNPLWVYLQHGERPAPMTLIGGLFLLAGVAVGSLVRTRR